MKFSLSDDLLAYMKDTSDLQELKNIIMEIYHFPRYVTVKYKTLENYYAIAKLINPEVY